MLLVFFDRWLRAARIAAEFIRALRYPRVRVAVEQGQHARHRLRLCVREVLMLAFISHYLQHSGNIDADVGHT